MLNNVHLQGKKKKSTVALDLSPHDEEQYETALCDGDACQGSLCLPESLHTQSSRHG